MTADTTPTAGTGAPSAETLAALRRYRRAANYLAAAQVYVGTEAESASDVRQGTHIDHGGAQLRQLPLGAVGVAAVQGVRHDQAQHGVPQELQPLVGGEATVLVGVGPVGQRHVEQLGIQGDAESGGQFGHRLGRGSATGVSCIHGIAPGAGQRALTLRPLYSRYRGVPAEAVTTRAWCGRA